MHDLGFLPYPMLSGAHTEHELALEWARHEIPGGLGIEGTGLITVRTLDLDHSRDPIKQLVERFPPDPAPQSAGAADLEFVLEDLALPVSAWLTPVATHGRFGLRRAVLQGGDEAEAYDLTLAPIEVDLSSRRRLAAEDLPAAVRDAGHRRRPHGGAVRRQRRGRPRDGDRRQRRLAAAGRVVAAGPDPRVHARQHRVSA